MKNIRAYVGITIIVLYNNNANITVLLFEQQSPFNHSHTILIRSIEQSLKRF